MMLAAAVLAVACGASTRVETAPEEGAAGATAAGAVSRTLLSFDAEVTQAICEWQVGCGFLSSVERCLEYRNGPVANPVLKRQHDIAYDAYFAGVDLIADLEHEYSLAGDATLDACLNDVVTSDCDQVAFHPHSCEQALVPIAPRAAGEACAPPSPFLAARPCQDGLECTCGICSPVAPRAAEGGACSSSLDCEPGLQCGANGACTRAPGLGQPCHGPCADGACVENLCVPLAGLGAPCGEEAACEYDLACVDGACVALSGLAGAPCTRAPDACLLWCVFDTPDSSAGTCGVPSTTGPTPCATYADDHGEFCPAGTVQHEDDGDDDDDDRHGCVCLPGLPLGAACDDEGDAARPCSDGICWEGECQPRRENGASCRNGNDCESQLCEPASGTCVPPVCSP